MLGLGNSIISGAALETTPADISGLQIWYKNATGLTGDPVSQWNDSSGNGRHAVQSTSNLQGSLSGGGIDFSDSVPQDFYNITESTGYVDMGGSNAFTLSVVMTRQCAAADDITVLGGANGNAHIMFLSEEYVRFRTTGTGGDATESQSFPTDTWAVNEKMVFTMTKDTSGDFLFWKNGVSVSPGNTTNESNTGPEFDAIYLGTKSDGTHDSNDAQFDGIMFEFVLYNTQLTGGDLSALNSYLTGKFSL